MTRLLSAAGVAVYVLAVSTAFPSVKEAGASLSVFSPAVAADAASETGAAERGAKPADAAGDEPAASAVDSVWHVDRDGMLMQETVAAEPLEILGAI